MLGWMAFLLWMQEVAFAGPLQPDPQSGAVAAFTYKGIVHYVQTWQAPLFNVGPFGFWLLWVVFTSTVGRWAFPEWNRPRR